MIFLLLAALVSPASAAGTRISGSQYCLPGLVASRENAVCGKGKTQERCAHALGIFSQACASVYEEAVKRVRLGAAPVAELEGVLDNARALADAGARNPPFISGLNETPIRDYLHLARKNELAASLLRTPVPGPAHVPALGVAAPAYPLPSAPARPRRSAVPYLAGLVAVFGGAAFLFARGKQEEEQSSPLAAAQGLAYVPVSKRGRRPERLNGVETLVEAYSKRGPFEPAFVRRVMAQACALVGAVHASGRGHGGVSPDSLVFDKDAVLSLLPPGPPTSFDGCAAPEGVASPRGDVFSLGATAYFLLVGRTPFDDSKAKADGEFVSASNRRTTLPLSIDLFFKRALAPDPSSRFADASDFRAAFDKALEPK